MPPASANRTSGMAEESLIEEMRAALRGDRERAESRQQAAVQPDAVVRIAEVEPQFADVPAPSPGASVRFEPAFEPEGAPSVPERPAPRGLLVRLASRRSRH